MTLFQACVLAVVEGLTEYLPVSSTGHIILASAAMGVPHDSFAKAYIVMVQFGAILAVLVEYFRFLMRQWHVYPILLIAFLPAAIAGLLLSNIIDQALGNVAVVGITLLVGGIALLFTDRLFPKDRELVTDVKLINMKHALGVGIFQCFALLPGVSRSAATIWGGLSFKMDRRTATEFSFLLALPTLTAATLYKGYKGMTWFTPDDWNLLIWGNIISFVVGWLAIQGFIQFVSKHGLKAFGYYRIAAGIITLMCWHFQWI